MRKGRKGGRGKTTDQRAAETHKTASEDHVIFHRVAVAREEIECAIKALFLSRAFAAAHVLSSAAREVLTPLIEAKGLTATQNAMDGLIEHALSSREDREDARQWMALPFNFFKHGSSKRDLRLALRPEYVVATLFLTIIDYGLLTTTETKIMSFFKSFAIITMPRDVADWPPEMQARLVESGLDKATFWDHLQLGSAEFLRQGRLGELEGEIAIDNIAEGWGVPLNSR